MGRRSRPVRLGDRFAKVGNPDNVFIVSCILDLENAPPHLHLTPEGERFRAVTFAVSAVIDTTLFQRLEAA